MAPRPRHQTKIVRPIKIPYSITHDREVIITKGNGYEVRVFERIKNVRGLHKGELKLHLGDVLEALEVNQTVFREAMKEWKGMSDERRIKYYGSNNE